MTNLAQQTKQTLKDLNVSVSTFAGCIGSTPNTIDRWARTGEIPRTSALLLTGINQWMQDLYDTEAIPSKYEHIRYRQVCNEMFKTLFEETYG